MVDQGDIANIMLYQRLPEGTESKEDGFMGFPEAFELPLKLSIAGHIHGVIAVLMSHAFHLTMLQLEDLVLFSERW